MKIINESKNKGKQYEKAGRLKYYKSLSVFILTEYVLFLMCCISESHLDFLLLYLTNLDLCYFIVYFYNIGLSANIILHLYL